MDSYKIVVLFNPLLLIFAVTIFIMKYRWTYIYCLFVFSFLLVSGGPVDIIVYFACLDIVSFFGISATYSHVIQSYCLLLIATLFKFVTF